MHNAADKAFRVILLRIVLLAFALGVAVGILMSRALAKDNGRFANSPLKPWFDQLKSGKGLCCSFADGLTVKDVDWDTAPVATADGNELRYRVRIDGHWIIVPPNAVVTEPNKFGRAVVWPYVDAAGVTQIRCFMPGAGT